MEQNIKTPLLLNKELNSLPEQHGWIYLQLLVLKSGITAGALAGSKENSLPQPLTLRRKFTEVRFFRCWNYIKKPLCTGRAVFDFLSF